MLKYELDINVCKFVADYVQCGFSTKEASAGKHRRIILYDIFAILPKVLFLSFFKFLSQKTSQLVFTSK